MKKKRIIFFGIFQFVELAILLLIYHLLANGLQDQQMADRWSEKNDAAQVSCFFSADANVTEDTILEFEHNLDKALQEASITSQSERPEARLWADAYSANGKITISYNNNSIESDAIGIGSDFFLFHPMHLRTGSFFSGKDVNKDYCVIDEDMAWQLFGSNDVDGMVVYIGGEPYIVTGVVERPRGRMESAAGLRKTVVYVSYETLLKQNENTLINHYEIVMPNPVSKFALNLVRERMGDDEQNVEIHENSSRFAPINILRVIAAFGTRSMNGRAIIYPYWENLARGTEDWLAVILFLILGNLLFFLILGIVIIARWWKHKTWTLKSIFLKCKDKWERYLERLREKRKRKNEDDDYFEETF